MTNYQKREFQYVILENIPENETEIALYIDASGYFPNVVLVINTTLNTVDDTFATMNEALDRYQEIGA